MKKKRKRTSYDVTITVDKSGNTVVTPEELSATKNDRLTRGDTVTFTAIGTDAVILNPHSPRNPNIKFKPKKKYKEFLADPEVLYVRRNGKNRVEFKIRSDTKPGVYRYVVFFTASAQDQPIIFMPSPTMIVT